MNEFLDDAEKISLGFELMLINLTQFKEKHAKTQTDKNFYDYQIKQTKTLRERFEGIVIHEAGVK